MILVFSVRITLTERAGFSFLQTKRLLITDGHRLITDGVFRYLRHPLYLGQILWFHIGIVLLRPSLWGAVLMALGAVSYCIRIRIEEEMLIEEFGDAYHEYRKHTKKIVPYIH